MIKKIFLIILLCLFMSSKVYAWDEDWYNRLQSAGDCDKTEPADGEVLIWDDTLELWVPGAVGSGSDQNLWETVTGDTGTTTANTTTDTLNIVGGGINTTSIAGDTVTITATEIDGSVSNEINTIQGDDNVATTGLAISIDGGTGITTDVVGDILTITASAGLDGWTDDGTTVRLTTSTDNVSIGADAEPNSEKLQVTGSTRTTGEFIEGTGSTTGGTWGLTQVTKTSSFTADNSISIYLCNATSGAIIATLPASSGATNRIYYIKKIDSSVNTVTIDGNASETIDGGTTAILTIQYEDLPIISDGSNWHIL